MLIESVQYWLVVSQYYDKLQLSDLVEKNDCLMVTGDHLGAPDAGGMGLTTNNIIEA